MLPGPGLVLTCQGARAEEQQGPRKVVSKTLPPIADTYLPNPVKSKESQRKLSYHLLVPSIHPSSHTHLITSSPPPPPPFLFFLDEAFIHHRRKSNPQIVHTSHIDRQTNIPSS